MLNGTPVLAVCMCAINASPYSYLDPLWLLNALPDHHPCVWKLPCQKLPEASPLDAHDHHDPVGTALGHQALAMPVAMLAAHTSATDCLLIARSRRSLLFCWSLVSAVPPFSAGRSFPPLPPFLMIARFRRSLHVPQVPPFADLPPIQGACLVKSAPPTNLDASSENLFSSLVPDSRWVELGFLGRVLTPNIQPRGFSPQTSSFGPLL